ncbi:MAG: HD domain-containing protein [Thermofilaceae archaeon]
MVTKATVLDASKNLAKLALGESFSHGYPHVVRVLRYARLIANEVTNVDVLLLELTVYLHDVGRALGEPHAYYSALIAKAFLEEFNMDSNFLELVANAIEYHSFSYAKLNKVEPKSVEAMILSDADKLDALGVVGFLRAFHHGWEKGRSLEETLLHFDEKLFRLKELLHYECSRKIAEKLEQRMQTILVWLEEEIHTL